MAKAGGRRRPKKARARRPQSAPGRPSASPSDPGPAPSQQEHVAAAIGAAVQAVCDGSQDAHGTHLDPLAIERAPGWTQAVSRTLVEYLRVSVTTAWQRGWQPAELARHVGRELSADARGDGLRHDHGRDARLRRRHRGRPLGRPGGRARGRRAGEGRLVGERRGVPERPVRARPGRRVHRHRRHRDRDAARCSSICPALERLLPLPGTARPAAAARPDGRPGGPRRSPADERMLGRIRALLAKAESTEFAEEAEALSGRAQELMAKYSIDHALLAAESGQAETPGGRRIAVDNPYEAPKATLLQIVAQANRCRVVWSKDARPGHRHRLPGRPGRGRAAVHLAAGPGQHRDAPGRRQAGRHGRSRTRAFRSRSCSPTRSGSASGCPRRPTTPSRRRWRSSGPRAAARTATARRRRREEGHRPGAVPRGAPPGGRRRGRRDVRRHASPGPGRSGRPTRRAGTPAAPPPTWPACITRPKSAA